MHRDRGYSACAVWGGRRPFLANRMRSIMGWGAMVATLVAPGLHAQNYAYDGNGRLVAATLADGTSTRYVYDGMGNLLDVRNVPAGTMSIFALRPNHGPVGQMVTIQGQGFADQPSGNLVSFNGVPAVVLSASVSSLTAQVPVNAATGPVSITANGQTATSDQPFVVEGNGLPPVIGSFAPMIVGGGAAVSVTGEHLAPVPGQTRLLVNAWQTRMTSTTDVALGFSAPVGAGSGHIVVQTPFGVATSANDLVIVPSGTSPGSIGAVVRLVPGGTQTISIPPSKTGVVLFDGGLTPDLQWLSLQQLAASGTTSESVALYDPRNNLVKQATLSATSPSFHMPRLTRPGSYSLYLTSSGSQASSVTLGLEVAPLLKIDAPAATPVIGSVPYMSKRYVFTAQPRIVAALPSITTSPAGGNVDIDVRDENSIDVGDAYGSTSVYLNLPSLVPGRPYQAVIAPRSGVVENTAVLLTTQPGGVLVPDGPTIAVNAPKAVNAGFSFDALPGDNLDLAISAVSMGAGGSATISVYDAKGTYIGGGSCSGSAPPSCRYPLRGLAPGPYQIIAIAGNAGSMAFQATLTREIQGVLTPASAQTFTSVRPGQSGSLTFQANAGDTFALGVSHIAMTPARNLEVSIIAPDGSVLTNKKLFNADGAINLTNLAVGGAYSVLVGQPDALPFSAQLMLAPQAGGVLTVDGASVSAAPIPGQSSYFSFDTTQVENLELSSTNFVKRSDCTWALIGVQDTHGNQPLSSALDASTLSFHLWNLAPGHYQVTVDTCGVNETLTLTRDIVASLSQGQTQSFSLPGNGKTIRYTFAGLAGQTIAVGPQSYTTTPSGKPVTSILLDPSGKSMGSIDSSTARLINADNLAATGTYTLVISPDNGIPASGQASYLVSASTTLVPDGAPQTVTTGVGQNAYLDFSSVGNESLQLGFSNLSTQGEGTIITYYVYNAAGKEIASNSLDRTSSPYSSRVSLTGLVAGNYSVKVVSSSGTAAFTVTATLSHELAATLPLGAITPVNIARQGQIARLTFTGMAGAVLTFKMTSLTTSPSGQTVNMTVYKPDGSSLGGSGMYGGYSYTLPALPATGSYTITLAPVYGVTANMNLLLQ